MIWKEKLLFQLMPHNADEYISTKMTIGELMREVLAEVNEKLPTYGELQELINILHQANAVNPPQGQSIKLKKISYK